jgi:hypothetical protein
MPDRKKIIIPAIFLTLLLITACAKKHKEDTITIAGVVRDAKPSGPPLPNVSISAFVNGKFISTKSQFDISHTPQNEAGFFSIAVPPLSQIPLSLSKEGYATKNILVKAYEGEDSHKSLNQFFLDTYIVKDNASLSLKVLDFQGPASAIPVFLIHSQNHYQETSTKTAEDGIALFDNIPADDGFQIIITPSDKNNDGIPDLSSKLIPLSLRLDSDNIILNDGKPMANVTVFLDPLDSSLKILWSNISMGILPSPQDIQILFNQSVTQDSALKFTLKRGESIIGADIQISKNVLVKIMPWDPLDNKIAQDATLPQYSLSLTIRSFSGALDSFSFEFLVLGSHDVGKVTAIALDSDKSFQQIITDTKAHIPIKWDFTEGAEGFFIFARSKNHPDRSDWEAVSEFITPQEGNVQRGEIQRDRFDQFLFGGEYEIEVIIVAVDSDGHLGPFPDEILLLSSHAPPQVIKAQIVEEVDCADPDIVPAEWVYITQEGFTPLSIQVSQGDIIGWVNYQTNMTATVTSKTDIFDSGDISPFDSVCFLFKKRGIFGYYDKYSQNEGEIVVE